MNDAKKYPTFDIKKHDIYPQLKTAKTAHSTQLGRTRRPYQFTLLFWIESKVRNNAGKSRQLYPPVPPTSAIISEAFFFVLSFACLSIRSYFVRMLQRVFVGNKKISKKRPEEAQAAGAQPSNGTAQAHESQARAFIHAGAGRPFKNGAPRRQYGAFSRPELPLPVPHMASPVLC
jgi:hypothetical protein